MEELNVRNLVIVTGNLKLLFRILANNSVVCNGKGTCNYISFLDTSQCSCNSPYQGNNCDSIRTCYGVQANDTTNVCSGKGACTNQDSCYCSATFGGINCQKNLTCNGYFFLIIFQKTI